jgi:hypothetical protein
MLRHVGENELLADVSDRRGEARDQERDANREGSRAHRRDGAPLPGERASPHGIGRQRHQRRHQLQRLEDAAPDVREGNDHRFEDTPGAAAPTAPASR